MTDWAKRLQSELDAADQRATKLAAGLTPLQINWKPREDAWSIGQCLEHLRVTNEVYLPPMMASLADQAHSPVPEITPGWFGRRFIRDYIEPSENTKRVGAPAKIAPNSQVDPNVLNLFLTSNNAAREFVRLAGAYDVNRIRFKNPFIPILRFTVGTGLEIISRHERRHLLQAERVKQVTGFPVD